MEGVNQASLVLNQRRLLTDWLFRVENPNQTTGHSSGKNIFHWYQCQNMSSGNVAINVPFAYCLMILVVWLGLQVGL